MSDKNEGFCKFGYDVICEIAAKCTEPDFSMCKEIIYGKNVKMPFGKTRFHRLSKENSCRFVGSDVFCNKNKTCKETSFPCSKHKPPKAQTGGTGESSKYESVKYDELETMSRLKKMYTISDRPLCRYNNQIICNHLSGCNESCGIYVSHNKPIERPDKPPLGAKPRYIWIEQRISELCEAIAKNANFELRTKWMKELDECLTMLDPENNAKIEDVKVGSIVQINEKYCGILMTKFYEDKKLHLRISKESPDYFEIYYKDVKNVVVLKGN